MAQETVTIRIKKDGSGSMSFETTGFQGCGCDIIKDIEMALGTVEKTEDTAERYLYENPDLNYINV
jgi:hypothetical protein